MAPPLLTAVAPAASREFILWQYYQKDTSMCPKNLTSILVTISISASWFFGQFNCRRVGLSASLLSASWFVGELDCRRVCLSASWCVGELVCRRVVHKALRLGLEFAHGRACASSLTFLYTRPAVCITSVFFELDNGGGHALRGHNWKLKVNRCRLRVRNCFFSQRIISIRNKLPATVVEASSVNSFKKRLDDWSKDVEL